MINCCYNCQCREVGCHSVCKTYLDAKAKHDEAIKAMNKDIHLGVTLRQLKQVRRNRHATGISRKV